MKCNVCMQENGDFLSVSTRDGKVQYRFKVGNGVGKLESQVTVNTNRWNKISIERWRNTGKLIVTYPDDEEARGDESASGGTRDDVQIGNTVGTDRISSMTRKNSQLVFGSSPLDQV